jgi:hypothetical protein
MYFNYVFNLIFKKYLMKEEFLRANIQKKSYFKLNEILEFKNNKEKILIYNHFKIISYLL